MFHTNEKALTDKFDVHKLVVIPWRGFRCFTPFLNGMLHDEHLTVVIPWRGFRCFTPHYNSTASGRRRQVAERGRPI